MRKAITELLEPVKFKPGELILGLSMRSPLNEMFQILEKKHREKRLEED
jgi:hypothetical protein